MFPSGNGNGNARLDNCNADAYANSVNTITIASITMSYNIADETEICPSALVDTFGSPDPIKDLFMNTTKPKDQCTFQFRGTSAATAYAAGMISHALRENANFSKRDIEHMLIETADKGFDQTNINWLMNGAGYKFNEKIGFGAINVTALKAAATTWKHVPEKRTCLISKRALFTETSSVKAHTREYSIESDSCFNTTNHVRYLEHVQLKVNISCNNITEVTLNLISPQGTKVGLLTTITVKENARIKYENLQWTFMSVHFWGEDPEGDWILQMVTDKNQPTVADVRIQAFILHGTENHPSVGGSQSECTIEDLPKSDNKRTTNVLEIALPVTAATLVPLAVVFIVVYCYCPFKRSANRNLGDVRTELTEFGSPQTASDRGPPRDPAEVPLTRTETYRNSL